MVGQTTANAEAGSPGANNIWRRSSRMRHHTTAFSIFTRHCPKVQRIAGAAP